jgi:hypothetical protein
MIPELDSEVADDLTRRSASERDPGRSRGPVTWAQLGKPAPIVEQWPCRGGCGTMIGVDAADVENLAIANRKLVARGERPIDKAEVMRCPACRAKELAQIAKKNAAALLPRQTEIPTDNTDPLAAYKPTPRRLPRGGRKLR